MTPVQVPMPSRVRIRHLPDPDAAPPSPLPSVPRPRPALVPASAPGAERRVLHVGCGERGPDRLHAIFRAPAWREVRVDLDPAVAPDIVASIADLSAVPDGSADAIWCSHSLEHLCSHEVAPALAEFRRVLAPGGFALIRSPDMAAVAAAILSQGLDAVAYRSPAGPVTVADMVYGHSLSIARGNPLMRHGTGFTAERLLRVLTEAGFAAVRTARTPDFTVWAVAFMPSADVARVVRALGRLGLALGRPA